MTQPTIERITLDHEGNQSLDVLRRNYQLVVETPRPGETIYKTLGEYAIHLPSGDLWRLLPAEQTEADPAAYNASYGRWATAEVLRIDAGQWRFLPEHMDLLEATLLRDQRITNKGNRLDVADKQELRDLLHEYNIPFEQWNGSGLQDLYDYFKPSKNSFKMDNVTLHDVKGELWIASAQTMLNVYHTSADGTLLKLRETSRTYYDNQGKPQPPVISRARSSIGETGQLIDGHPERPFNTARRALHEELGIEDDSAILQITSTASLLRQKTRGHHYFRPIKAEDHTHYFDVVLDPDTVRTKYINEERADDGRLYETIELAWFTGPSQRY